MGPDVSPRERWSVLLVSIAVLALAWTELADGDLGFHLATGREVLNRGGIPDTNVLSYTNPDHPWHLHQWLPGVLFEWTWRAWGVHGLQAVKLLLIAATWSLVFAAARVAGASAMAAAWATLLGGTAAAFRFELRPHLFTHLALAGELALCARYLRSAGDATEGRRAWLGALIVPPLVAAHLHAGVIDSWLLLLALAFAVWAKPLRGRGLEGLATASLSARGRSLAPLSALVASVGLAALSLASYHPVGARILLFPFDMGSDAYLAEHLIEFRMPIRFPLSALAPYWILVLGVLTALVAQRRTLHPFWPLAAIGFLLLSLKHVRLAFGFAIVASPVIGLGLDSLLRVLRPRLTLWLTAALCLAAVLFRYQQATPGSALAARTFPPYLFDYLDRHGLQGPDYVSDAWAAPLLGRAYPTRKAFFDNRFEAYPRSFFLDVYQHIRYGRTGWDRLLDAHRVQLVLLRYTSPGEARLQQGKPNLRQRIVRDPRWSLVTFDDLGMLLVRRDGTNAAHARAFALPGLDPDKMGFTAAPALALPHLRRELARGNDATRVLLLASQGELESGHPDESKRLLARAVQRPDAPQLFEQMQHHLSGHAPTRDR